MVLLLAVACLTSLPLRSGADDEGLVREILTSDHMSGEWGGARTALEDHGIDLEVAYTGDYVYNTLGGLERRGAFLGNLDMTLTLQTWQMSDYDFGTFFLYGLVDHGGKPTDFVGDLQGTDNIQAPDAIKLFELWWQRAFFDGRLSVLAGLYDVNSEFYVVESAELFMNSSFGIGPEVGLSGINGPSIFPFSSLAFRVLAEPGDGWQVSAAVMDGVPGNPGRPESFAVEFNPGDGVFFIMEATRTWAISSADDPDLLNPARRRRVGRTIDQRDEIAELTLGTWVYSTNLPDLESIAAGNTQSTKSSHPGLYLLAELDATNLSIMPVPGLAAFVQLGWADQSVNPFTGYTGAGLVYTGLIPFRPADSFGVGFAAGFVGDAYEALVVSEGNHPAFGELALELTYRAYPVPWFSVQADLQWVINPSGLENRPNALVPGVRFVVDL